MCGSHGVSLWVWAGLECPWVAVSLELAEGLTESPLGGFRGDPGPPAPEWSELNTLPLFSLSHSLVPMPCSSWA